MISNRLTIKQPAIYIAACTFVLISFSSILAADSFPSSSPLPHPHQGVLLPYTTAPENIELSEKEQKRLAQFKPVYKKLSIGDRQRGVAIFRVAASKEVIWSVIRNFPQYPQWINELKSTNVYQQKGSHTYVRFDARHWLLGKTTWFVKHDFPTRHELKDRNWGSWTLDYRHRSDFNDSVGFWQVIPVEENVSEGHAGEGGSQKNKELSDIIYSVDLSLKNAPIFIRNGAIKKGLKTATQWVKQQAEVSTKNNK